MLRSGLSAVRGARHSAAMSLSVCSTPWTVVRGWEPLPSAILLPSALRLVARAGSTARKSSPVSAVKRGAESILVASRGGLLTADNITLTDYAQGGGGAIGGDEFGGQAGMVTSDGGMIEVGDYAATAFGYGGLGQTAGGDGLGGAAFIGLQGGNTTVSGAADVDASGFGGQSIDGDGGDGTEAVPTSPFSTPLPEPAFCRDGNGHGQRLRRPRAWQRDRGKRDRGSCLCAQPGWRTDRFCHGAPVCERDRQAERGGHPGGDAIGGLTRALSDRTRAASRHRSST